MIFRHVAFCFPLYPTSNQKDRMHLPTFYFYLFLKNIFYLFGGYYSYFITMKLSVNLVNDSPTLLIVFFFMVI